MSSLTHGFTIREDGCDGCMSCMRACPTHAIRVKDGKARYAPDRCIDCGTCLTACPRDVITATTSSVEDLGRFRFKVAVPSPVLFGQFPAGITPAHITEGLRALGFDAIWNYAAEVSLVSRAIHDYVENWKGAFPLISISCPVVVRLLQVSYPRMVDQLIRVQPPARSPAGRSSAGTPSNSVSPETRSRRSTSRPAKPRPSPSCSPRRAGKAISMARSGSPTSTTPSWRARTCTETRTAGARRTAPSATPPTSGGR